MSGSAPGRVPGPGDWDDRSVDRSTLRPDTLAVRGGLVRSEFQEMSEALFLTQGYVYDSAAQAESAFAGDVDRFLYSRYSNPTVSTFEERLRLLDGAEAAYATATGMSAVFTALAALVRQGSRVVAARALFGSSVVIFDEILAAWGVRTDYVDGHVSSQWEEALSTPADVVFFETPSNPMQDLVDIATVSRLAHAAGATVVVDNVFATPVLSRPLDLGADVVVYSATKHIDGQGRVLGGAILGSAAYVRGPVQTLIRNTGPSLSPFNAWVLLKGLETMSLRVRHQAASALDLAGWLEQHPAVASVRYPFLPSHPQHELARAQQTGGGTVVTLNLRVPEGATPDVAKKSTFAFLDALRVVDISNNLGDAKSIVTHPATTTHRKLGPEGRAAVGIAESTVRLSVGLEDVEDLREDLAQALDHAL
ncbi:O-succinylhomoserine sulfhydrylase [Cellulomonas fimi]|uniref:O-succinylhomoserine sulfhydrylase n=1 Tax=Cellulomonas fimi (strain ATCC 484 / DSM 20113 / JCM 1341 / CCUG 24087 / LMG 16345 / NBRC 15513 / NCIMB 8980 / NCTC 7547 / NRS-133) TaxID=590998 RepID=F4H0F0_CELFA|nr:O-succinylhomoserine sulfhydrylase [Cellulomonas fimi ATCC 484]NNH05852.1 O-succinylhomoserine sulfhydrylase [Cellulomonas fimi]VEH35909.1 O-succinylhomoserine sulfhydrylase [Cellulomonas fimi]